MQMASVKTSMPATGARVGTPVGAGVGKLQLRPLQLHSSKNETAPASGVPMLQHGLLETKHWPLKTL